MNILVLGDSITFGHGCGDRVFYWDYKNNRYIGNADFSQGPSAYCWASLLEADGHLIKNLSRSGNSNSNMVWDCLEEVHNATVKYDYIMAHFSYDDRIQFAHPYYKQPGNTDEIVNASPLHPPQFLLEMDPNWKHATENYLNHLYHPQWGVKLTHMAIHAVANIAKEIGAKYSWSAPEFNQTHNSHLLSSPLRDVQVTSIIERFNIFNKSTANSNFGSPYVAVDGHPSELAHAEYCNTVIKPLLNS
jgi:hypothetical protein